MKPNELRNIVSEEIVRVIEQEAGKIELAKLNENKYRDVSDKFKDALDRLPDKAFTTKNIEKLIKKMREKRPDAAMAYTKDAFGWLMKEGKLNEEKWTLYVDKAKLKTYGSKRAAVVAYNKILNSQQMQHITSVKITKEGKINEAPQVAPQTRMEFGVEYRDSKGKPKKDNPLIKRFKTKSQADSYAKKGNKVDKVGGKYTVVQVPIEEKFDSKAQQRYMFATNPKAAKKLASKMTAKDYDELPDKVSKENVAPDHDGKAAPFGSGYKKVKDLEESTKAYEKALQKMARDNKLKMLSKSDKEKLIKIAQMLKKANESVNEGKKEDAAVEKAIIDMVDSMIKAGKRPGEITKHLKSQVPYKITTNAIRKLIKRPEIKPGEWLNESMIGIKTKANFKPLQLKGALEKAGIKGFKMDRLSVTLTALKLDKKYFNKAKEIVDKLGLSVMMAKESLSEATYKKGQKVKYQIDKGSIKALKPSEGTISKVKKVGKYVQYTIMDGGPVPVWEPEILGLSGADKKAGKGVFESVVNEATSLWKHFDAKMKLQDTIMDLEYEMKMINRDLSQLHKDMEQEAEPEGGPKATRYGKDIEKKEKEYKKKKAEFKKLMKKLDKMEQY